MMLQLVFAASLLLGQTYGGTYQRVQGNLPLNANTSNFATSAQNVVAGGNVTTNAVNANTVAAGQGNVVLSQDGNGAAALSLQGNELFWCNATQCFAIPGKLQVGGGSAGSVLFGPATSNGILLSSASGVLTFTNGAGSGATLTGSAFKASTQFYMAAAGTAAFPAFAGSGISNAAGVYFPTASTLKIATNGADALAIDGNQEVQTAGETIVAKTTSYSMSSTDRGTIFSNAGATGAITITTYASPHTGDRFGIMVSANQTINVSANGGASIMTYAGLSAAATRTCSTQYAVVWFRFDGTNWVGAGTGTWS